MSRANTYLEENFGIALLTDEEIVYDDVDARTENWDLSEGPNAKNTVNILTLFIKD